MDKVFDGKIILRWQNHRCPKPVWRLHVRISHQLCALYGSKKTLYHTKSRHHILSPRESNSSLGARTENNLPKKLSSPCDQQTLVTTWFAMSYSYQKTTIPFWRKISEAAVPEALASTFEVLSCRHAEDRLDTKEGCVKGEQYGCIRMVWVQSIREHTADNRGIIDVSRRLYPIDSPIVGG